MKNPNGVNEESLVPAVDRAVQLLKLFRDAGETYGVSELARRLDLNKSTLHGILNTLSYHHLIERDEKTKTYRLGYALSELGDRAGANRDVRAVAHPFVRALGERLQETVLLGVYREGSVVLVDKQEPPHDFKIGAPIGHMLPFAAGAFGYVFCAALPRGELERLVDQYGLRAFTRSSSTRLPLYLRRLKRVRAVGYALDDQEYLDGVRGVAAPVVNAGGQVAAALCVVGLSGRVPKSGLDQLGGQVREIAEQISQRLGATVYPEWNGVGL